MPQYSVGTILLTIFMALFCARKGEMTYIWRLQVYHKDVYSLRSFMGGSKVGQKNIFASLSQQVIRSGLRAQRLADGPILVVTRIIDRGHFELLRFRPCIFFVSHFLSFRFTRISPIESLRCNYLKGREGGTGKPWYHTGRVRPNVSRHGHGIGFPWSNFIFYFVLSEKYYIPNKF